MFNNKITFTTTSINGYKMVEVVCWYSAVNKKGHIKIYEELSSELVTKLKISAIDKIHSHNAMYGLVIGSEIKIITNCKLFLTEHKFYGPKHWKNNDWEYFKEKHKLVDSIFLVSHDKYRQILLNGFDVNRVLWVGNFVDELKFNNVVKKYVVGDVLKVIVVTSNDWIKDNGTWINALELLAGKWLNIQVSIVLSNWGQLGRIEKQLERLIQKMENKPTVYKDISLDEVALLMQQHHVILSSSIQEGLSVALAEGLTTGLYVISTTHGGVEDYINSDMGSLVKIKDVNKMALELEKILNGSITWEPEKNRQKAMSLFSSTVFREKLLKEYYL